MGVICVPHRAEMEADMKMGRNERNLNRCWKRALTVALLAFSSFALCAADIYSWDFYYVTEKISGSASPLVWFSKGKDDPSESGTSSEPLSQDGPTSLYLHSETTGLVDLKLTVTPLSDGRGGYVHYNFSVDGGVENFDGDSIKSGVDVTESNITIPLIDENQRDPALVLVIRLYELVWTIDETSSAEATAGTYTGTVTVEVTCE